MLPIRDVMRPGRFPGQCALPNHPYRDGRDDYSADAAHEAGGPGLGDRCPDDGHRLGAIFAPYLAPAALVVLAAGLLLHAWGMYDKHRLERDGGAWPPYATALYRLCWALLVVLAAWLLLRAA